MTETFDRYLSEVDASLLGPARDHRVILAELRSGLLDATDARVAAGLPYAKAVAAAIAEFGSPAVVADGFRHELAATQSRRVAIRLLVTGPLVAVLWIVTALTSRLGIRLEPPWQWSGLSSAGLRLAIQLVALAAGVTAVAALTGIAATGRLVRWLPAGPRRAPTAAAIAGLGAVGADSVGLALLAAELVIGPGRLSPAPATAAAVASLARILLARRAAWNCLAVRATLALWVDAVADVGGPRRIDHPHDVQFDPRRQGVEQPAAGA